MTQRMYADSVHEEMNAINLFAEKEGWALVLTEESPGGPPQPGHYLIEIQSWDASPRRFSNDEAAKMWVDRRAGDGSELHRAAKKIVNTCADIAHAMKVKVACDEGPYDSRSFTISNLTQEDIDVIGALLGRCNAVGVDPGRLHGAIRPHCRVVAPAKLPTSPATYGVTAVSTAPITLTRN